ncbi:MAG: CHAD domain-containing protein [Variovorax sp.]
MEIEFKFQVPSERLEAVQSDLRSAKVTPIRMQALYFDTADGALTARGVVLRLRKEGRRWVQTAKAPGTGPLHRLEHEVELDAAQAAAPQPDAGRHAGSPVGKLLDELLDGGKAELVEKYATDIRRLVRQERFGDSTIELALDVGEVVAKAQRGRPRRSDPVCELELELVEGSVQDLVALARRWSERHHLWFSTLSKDARGKRLLAPPEDAVAVKAAPTQYPAGKLTGVEVQRAVAAACLAQILPNATEVAAGSKDPDVVHQLRVGIRRLRTALRELGALALDAGSFDAAWEAPLVDAFRALGASRDRELLQTTVQPRLREAGAPPIEVPEDEANDVSVGAAVRSPSFQSVLVSLIGFTAPGDEKSTDGADAGATTRTLAKRLNKLHRQVVRGGKRFEALAPDEQHGVRKRLKRLRYLAEFVAPLFGNRKAMRYIAELTPAQDALGEFNDALVAIEAYRAAAAHDPHAWFAVGWLIASQPERMRDCTKALAKIGKVRGFWKKKD